MNYQYEVRVFWHTFLFDVHGTGKVEEVTVVEYRQDTRWFNEDGSDCFVEGPSSYWVKYGGVISATMTMSGNLVGIGAKSYREVILQAIRSYEQLPRKEEVIWRQHDKPGITVIPGGKGGTPCRKKRPSERRPNI